MHLATYLSFFILAGAALAGGGLHDAHPARSSETETPQYTVVHTESDFQIRLYRRSVWACAAVTDASFLVATVKGFHRLFQYIEGANLNWSHIPMTTPALTGLNPTAGPFSSAAYIVRLYLPTAFQDVPPTPIPEVDVEFERWDEVCIATRTFSGFAKDNNVAKEAASLAASLGRSPWANATVGDHVPGRDSYAIAQYNGPFTITGRVNEVWVTLPDSFVKYGCQAPGKTASDSASACEGKCTV